MMTYGRGMLGTTFSAQVNIFDAGFNGWSSLSPSDFVMGFDPSSVQSPKTARHRLGSTGCLSMAACMNPGEQVSEIGV